MPETDDTTTAEEAPAQAGDETPVEGADTGTAEPAEIFTVEPTEPAGTAAAEPAGTEAGEAADGGLVEAVGRGLTWIPYAAYLGLWIILAGATAYLLRGASPEQPARWIPTYEPLVWAGVALVAVGPLLSLGVWLVARTRREPDQRQGLLTAAAVRGALTAFFGAVIWLVTLYVIEVVTLGGSV